MKPGYFTIILFMGALIVIAVSCATPRLPTGGPPDRTPPVITQTEPVNETVNFDGREVVLNFSKFMNRNTLIEALNIEPDLDVEYDIDWGRQRAVIRFREPLPENTTILIRVGTELQDTRNNNLASPFDLALSTGPVIDEGLITGRLRESSDGSAEEGMRVYLYKDPIDLESRASYVAQTDTAGNFSFPYMSQGDYLAIWFDDLNRDRTWNQARETAQPFPISDFTLEEGGERDLGTIYINRPDTTAPALQGVGLLTESYLRLRFNEEVYWDTTATISILDSLNNVYTEAFPLYIPPEDNLVLFAQALEPLSPDEEFTIRFQGVTDGAGNIARFAASPFTGSAQPDTVRLKIIGDNREPGLFPDEPLVVGYSRFINDDDVTDSLKVVEGEDMMEEWDGVDIDRHRLNVYPDGEWVNGVLYQFLVWNPNNQQLRPIEPTIWRWSQLGSMIFTTSDTLQSDNLHLRLFDTTGKVDINSFFSVNLEVEELPPLTYTAIIYRDENQDGEWNPGTVIPFEPPEPYFVEQEIQVPSGLSPELLISFE